MLLGEDIEKEHGFYNNFVECQEQDVKKVKKDTGLVFEPFFFFPPPSTPQGSASAAFFGGTIYACGVVNLKS